MSVLLLWIVATALFAVPWILWDRHYKPANSFFERFNQIRQELLITILAGFAGLVVLVVAHSLGLAGS